MLIVLDSLVDRSSSGLAYFWWGVILSYKVDIDYLSGCSQNPEARFKYVVDIRERWSEMYNMFIEI